MAKRSSIADAPTSLAIEQLAAMLVNSLKHLQSQVDASPVPITVNSTEVGRVVSAAQAQAISAKLTCRIRVDDRSLAQRLKGAAHDMSCARLDAIWLEGTELVLVRVAIAPPVVAIAKSEAPQSSETVGEGE
ncbi:MAG: hypothetical protein QNJ46_07960 [Leptolyngbyaceae cyanobacterium MO_188.B28]|nr:hypothetical protein [Leptolyngbyaceae cyanobacterium MO_188.B28]